MLANMGACAPKLFAIANDVVDHEDKAIQLSKLHIQLAFFFGGKLSEGIGAGCSQFWTTCLVGAFASS